MNVTESKACCCGETAAEAARPFPGGCPCGGPEAAAWDAVADVIVRTCARVQEGQVVQLGGGVHALPLLEALALAVRRVGAFPELNLSSQRLLNRMVVETPLEYLARPPAHRLRWLEDVDVVIATDTLTHPEAAPGLSRERRAALAAGWEPLDAAMAARGIPSFYVPFRPGGVPAEGGDAPADLNRMIQGAIQVDYETIGRLGKRLVARLEEASEMRITGPGGADLRLTWNGIQCHAEDGMMDDDDREAGQTLVELPAGLVVAVPLQAAPEGRWTAPVSFVGERKVDDPFVIFRQGRVQEVGVSGEGLAAHGLPVSRPSGIVVSRLVFGLNPHVTALTGDPVLDLRKDGAVAVVLQDGRFLAQGQPGWEWPLVLPAASLWLDGQQVLDGGRWLL